VSDETLVMGAVAYDTKVVTIWNGFREWLREAGFDFDYILYSNYERQVEDLVAGRIHAAWNSPLAAVRAERLSAARGSSVRAVVMRDSDRDLTSVVVARPGSGIAGVEDLRGRTIAVGAVDSPQATLIPLAFLHEHGLRPGIDVTVRRYDVGVGLHGDHIGGERNAARALAAGEVDAACMIDGNHLLFTQEGTLPPSAPIVAQTAPYDHCTMTVGADSPAAERFTDLFLAMSYDDAEVRPLLDLEGLRVWEPGRVSGYDALRAAVDLFGFYAVDGAVTAQGYRP
jgi:phosphonate transport system substrate-binding protein